MTPYLNPLRNPLGFGPADFIELAVGVMLVALVFSRPLLHARLRRFSSRKVCAMLVLALLPVMLRLALLPHFPVPTPTGSDDFSHLLVADTLSHFRLANPAHPLHQFFEAIYILQEPSYSSMYPPGQGLLLAIGQTLSGTPWAGVLLCAGAFCALCYWMLRPWVDPLWALAGGLLAVFQFGPLSQWMNTYWTSPIPAVAGCLVFGALARLRNCPPARMAVLTGMVAGAGLALHLITRPFETVLLTLAAVAYLPLLPWRTARRTLMLALVAGLLMMLPAVALLLFQNKAVTGNWTTLPYQLSRYEYGIPATFVFQPNPQPHRRLTPEQDLNYRAQAAIHGDEPETLSSYLQRLGYRIRYYRFFVVPPLYPALLIFLVTIREWRYLWAPAALSIFALGSNFYPYFYPHYVGAAAPLLILMCVVGLQKLTPLRIGPVLFMLCTALFCCWYGIALSGREEWFPALRYDEWNFINHGDPEGRIAVNDALSKAPGKQLVFVHYLPQHRFHEWVHNAAGIDAARIVWALDLGDEENRKLINYYPGRTVWTVEPDALPPSLKPYRP